jgi:hypothetical protein
MTWSLDLASGAIAGVTVGVDGTLYVTAANALAAVSSAGTLLWKRTANSPGISAPTLLGDDRILFSNAGRVTAAIDGTRDSWSTSAGMTLTAGRIALGADGVIRAGFTDLVDFSLSGVITATDTKATLGQPVVGDDGTTYIPSSTGFRVLAPNSVPVDVTLSSGAAGIALASDGIVAVTGTPGSGVTMNVPAVMSVEKLAYAAFTPIWTTNLAAGSTPSAPVIDSAGTIYFVQGGSVIDEVSPSGVVTSKTLGLVPNGSAPIIGNGSVYFGTTTGICQLD